MKRIILYVLAFPLFTFGVSCKKYLDTKPDQSLTTPDDLKDLRAILDTYQIMNRAVGATNSLSDEYYLDYSSWLSLQEGDRSIYIYDSKINFQSSTNNDWVYQYATVLYANTVLENLEKISPKENSLQWKDLKGEALFFRAYSFYELAQLYSLQYDSTTANTDLGIVLQLTSDFNKPSRRAALGETFNQILGDLKKAETLLYDHVLPVSPAQKTRPGRPAVYALLARIYLQMGDYGDALKYADRCLDLYDTLVDYNLIQNTLNPFPIFFPEVIYYTNTADPINILDWLISIDSTLYSSYSKDDLRKELFYEIQPDNRITFKGSYNGGKYQLFNGIATDEVYLIRAECYARLGEAEKGTKDLNHLLEKRWRVGTFSPYQMKDPDDVLKVVLRERRKELVNRGLRWSDIKRLNKDPRFAITLRRVLDGKEYTLPPNDLRYAFWIPDGITKFGNVQQNPR